ncbi:MAG: type II toxin-antitoxin system HicA family toxin [Patescibacteria group bacterium]
MPKLPVVSANDLLRALSKIGFEKVSQRGGHIKVRDKSGRVAIIPNHKRLKPGTLKKGILNPLGINTEEFIKLLKS